MKVGKTPQRSKLICITRYVKLFHIHVYRKSCRVVVSESVTVPPETEIIINGSVIDECSLKDCGVLKMAPALVETNCLLVAIADCEP